MQSVPCVRPHVRIGSKQREFLGAPRVRDSNERPTSSTAFYLTPTSHSLAATAAAAAAALA